MGEDSAVQAFLRKGINYYHAGYLAEDFDAAKAELESQGCRPMGVFHSEAFAGRRCEFFLNQAFHLMEIIEKGRE